MTKKLRELVWNKYGKKCAYCGKPLEYKELQVDHIKAKRRRKGPEVNDISNLNPSCRRCNHYKRGLSLINFRRRLKTLHLRIQDQYIDKVAMDYGIITVQKWDGIFWFEKYQE
ncbi:MAG TPA: HNH endonuclease signature motif containing protein [Caldisericia bacterium]|jgi:5-methylcytosine-specific restriction endonuclease McrA|nr:HNH endonuclease signature motif containing protein [Caldisericia bacterium]